MKFVLILIIGTTQGTPTVAMSEFDDADACRTAHLEALQMLQRTYMGALRPPTLDALCMPKGTTAKPGTPKK